MKSRWDALVVLVFAFGCSLLLVRNDYVNDQDVRGPASACPFVIPEASLKKDLLARRTILSHLQVQADDKKGANLLFGNFFEGQGSVCDVYKKVSFEYEGVGVYSSGQPTRMVVSGLCRNAIDACQVGLIGLPLKKYFAERPADLSEQIAQDSIKIVFDHTADEWPERWLLKRIVLGEVTSDKKIVLGPTELESAERFPLSILKSKPE